MFKVGIIFSRPLENTDPLVHIGSKYPVYVRSLELCSKKGWEIFVLTRKTYLGKGIFKGGWIFKQESKNKFKLTQKLMKMDLVYDRTGGVKFPPKNEPELSVVNNRKFKVLCWDKWMGYQKIGKYMPQTFWVGEKENLAKVLPKIKTDWVVLKPYNGLKGLGIFIETKEKASDFEFLKNYPKYIAQEFLDTAGGIPGIVKGLHDLRVVVINGKTVWSHVRTPPPGSFEANVARGGKIKEVAYSKLPDSVKKITNQVAKIFYEEFDNPVFSLDFGMGKKKPWIFEINDQIGFPTWEMKNRDNFLKALVENFEKKLVRRS